MGPESYYILCRPPNAVFGLSLYFVLKGLAARFRGGREPRWGDAVVYVLEGPNFPLLTPVTGTVVILNAVLVWNDFMSPLLYLSGSQNQTIPVAIYGFVSEFTTVWPVVVCRPYYRNAAHLDCLFRDAGQDHSKASA